jgi:hypothetical protein
MSKKITFLVLALIVVFSFNLTAEPTLKPINTTIPTVSNSKAWVDAVKICDNINYRSLFPMVFQHICVAPGGQAIAYFGRGTTTTNYHGFYAYYSTDFGASWTQTPATGPVITPETYYERIYSAMELGSASLLYAPYTANNIRIPSGGALGDTAVFAADLGGLGAGDWFSLVIADNSDGAYRYMQNITVVNDADVFSPMMDINGDFYLHHSDDYGMTWSQLYHFDPTFFTPLISPLDDSVISYDGSDMPKIIYMPTSGDLVFIGDIYQSFKYGPDTVASAGLFYTISSDMGVTWGDPQWVVSTPTALPVGFEGAGPNWAGWNARLTSDEKIVATCIYSNAADDEAKMFGHVYNGTSWTTINITPPTGDSGYIWNGLGTMYGQQDGLLVDGAGNAFCIWEDVIGVVIEGGVLTGVIPGLVGVKYDGTSWKNIEILDTIPAFAYFNAADKVDDNGNCLIALNMYDDSLHIFSVPAPTGISEKKHTSITKLDLTAPGLVRNSTTIRFSVVNSGYGKLDIFDMSGKLVKTLVNGNVNAGNHSATWNRTDNRNEKVSGGVYFYKLTVGNETVTRKIIAVK